jgi:hypothetical protein
VDFAVNVWHPGRAVVAGEDPFVHLSAREEDDASVYPPIATVITLPFTLPPLEVARFLWVVTLLLAVIASLRVCGVRDWRCYLAACACPPVLAGLMYGSISLLLVFAVALAWRFRDKAWLVGSIIGTAVAVKFFLWPLVVWLAITRRRLALAASVASAGLLSVLGWASVGFARFTDYPALLRDNTAKYDQDGVSVAAIAANLGLPAHQVIALGAGLLVLAVAWSVRRNDLGAFAWAIAAALLASPIVWWHYYALLLVPLALAVPAWKPVWFAPFAMFPQAADAVLGMAVSLLISARASGVTIPAVGTYVRDRSAERSRSLPQGDRATGAVASRGRRTRAAEPAARGRAAARPPLRGAGIAEVRDGGDAVARALHQ